MTSLGSRMIGKESSPIPIPVKGGFKLEKGEYFVLEGTGSPIALLTSGLVVTARNTASGEDICAGIFRQASIAGEPLSIYPQGLPKKVKALEAATFQIYPRDKLIEASPQTYQTLQRARDNDALLLEQRGTFFPVTTVAEKVAWILLYLTEYQPNRKINQNQDILALVVGSARIHINRTLKLFERADILQNEHSTYSLKDSRAVESLRRIITSVDPGFLP